MHTTIAAALIPLSAVLPSRSLGMPEQDGQSSTTTTTTTTRSSRHGDSIRSSRHKERRRESNQFSGGSAHSRKNSWQSFFNLNDSTDQSKQDEDEKKTGAWVAGDAYDRRALAPNQFATVADRGMQMHKVQSERNSKRKQLARWTFTIDPRTSRFIAKGLDAQHIWLNVPCLPSSTPTGQRLWLFRH